MEHISVDVLSVILNFVPLSQAVHFCHVNKRWRQAFQRCFHARYGLSWADYGARLRDCCSFDREWTHSTLAFGMNRNGGLNDWVIKKATEPDIEYAIGKASFATLPFASFCVKPTRLGSEFRVGFTADAQGLKKQYTYTLSDKRLFIISDRGGIYNGSLIAESGRFKVGTELVISLDWPLGVGVVTFYLPKEPPICVPLPWAQSAEIHFVICLDAKDDSVNIRPLLKTSQ